MKVSTSKAFGEMIREKRKKLGITQKYICEVSGISASFIADDLPEVVSILDGYENSKSLLETTQNTRDLGGHLCNNGETTKYNRIIRSDKQSYPNDRDIDFLTKNGITTIIDLREEKNVKSSPSAFVDREGFTYYNFPIEEGSHVPESVEAVPGSYMEIAASPMLKSVYKKQIRGWFDKVVKASDHAELHKAILTGDTNKIADYLSCLLEKSISYFDSNESFYHGFFLSLLYGVPSYSPRSNREEGNGRTDIVLYPNKPKDPAIIFELKVRKKFNEMQDGLGEAYKQIRDCKYEEGVLEDGYVGAVSYGICFCKKSCIVGKYLGE